MEQAGLPQKKANLSQLVSWGWFVYSGKGNPPNLKTWKIFPTGGWEGTGKELDFSSFTLKGS